IVGARVPPNYGASYAQRFADLFTDVAKARHVPVVPDLFAGFGEDLAQFQADRIHPVASAEPAIVANVWPTLAPLLSRR
ncbi:MAG: arylesterase, partial [Betaproteobacteria bacterium]